MPPHSVHSVNTTTTTSNYNKLPSLYVYTDFDSTVILKDSGDILLASIMGEEELLRIDRLPETDPSNVSVRKAEDMKWDHVTLSIQDTADLLVFGSVTVTTGSGETMTKNVAKVELDPAFAAFHSFCRENHIPLIVVTLSMQPLIEAMLDRYLGQDHGILVRGNGLEFRKDGSWKVLRRDSSPFGLEKGRALREARERDLRDPSTDQILWCGDGSGDFPAALESDLVLARENTSLERLCRANNVVHTSFSTFATVQSIAEEWLQNHPGAQTSEEVKAYYKSWQLKVSNPQEP